MMGLLLMTGVSVTASMLLIQTAILPLVIKFSKAAQRKLIFANCLNFPRHPDYDDPSTSDVQGGRNFYVEFHSTVDDCPIKLGVWHILPLINGNQTSEKVPEESDRMLQELVNTRNPVILYFHGNSNHRACPNRIMLYKIFQQLNFHVLTFDYRGYGDSTQVHPTESGVVEDSLQVYSWLMNTIDSQNRPTVILWGHSLGTAVASNLASHLPKLCAEQHLNNLPMPDALILEAPFNNLMEEIEKHPYTKLVSWLPYYHKMFIQPFLTSSEFEFATDSYLSAVPRLPIMILHAECDEVIPFQLAVKLFDTLAETRKAPRSAPLVFHCFSKWTRIGHNNICRANDLRGIIKAFLRIVETRKIQFQDQ